MYYLVLPLSPLTSELRLLSCQRCCCMKAEIVASSALLPTNSSRRPYPLTVQLVSNHLAAKKAEACSSVDRRILGHASWARRPDEITQRRRHDDGWGPSPDFHRACGKTLCFTVFDRPRIMHAANAAASRQALHGHYRPRPVR